MAHFSEMEFLFLSTPNDPTHATKLIDNTVGDNERSIYSKGSNDTSYYVYKGAWGGRYDYRAWGNDSLGYRAERHAGNHGTDQIKNYTKTSVYPQSTNNPYVDLIKKFDGVNSSKSLIIKASDLAYLRELGVYPINRMVILRRFDDGLTTPEKLDELDVEPIATAIGWLKEDDNYGKFSFNEDWTTTQKRLDELFGDMLKNNFAKGSNIKSIMPVPNFARGILFGLMEKIGIVGGSDSPWTWDNLPIGNPNVLQEGPYRDPGTQNIKSDIKYSFETTYEQKFIGDVDPGAAIIDIIDNLLKMGTSDMKYWLNGESGVIAEAKREIQATGLNNLNYWWILVQKTIEGVMKLIGDVVSGIGDLFKKATGDELSLDDKIDKFKEFATDALGSLLAATVSKYRWELKGSIEMMTGRDSSTPWYLTIGNPYSPWLATNHIIVNRVDIETSPEVGFNDMPMWLKATFDVSQSRNLGRNEIIRMFNNSFLREYSKYDEDPIENTPTTGTAKGGGVGGSTDPSEKGGTGPGENEQKINKNEESNVTQDIEKTAQDAQDKVEEMMKKF